MHRRRSSPSFLKGGVGEECRNTFMEYIFNPQSTGNTRCTDITAKEKGKAPSKNVFRLVIVEALEEGE